MVMWNFLERRYPPLRPELFSTRGEIEMGFAKSHFSNSIHIFSPSPHHSERILVHLSITFIRRMEKKSELQMAWLRIRTIVDTYWLRPKNNIAKIRVYFRKFSSNSIVDTGLFPIAFKITTLRNRTSSASARTYVYSLIIFSEFGISFPNLEKFSYEKVESAFCLRTGGPWS